MSTVKMYKLRTSPVEAYYVHEDNLEEVAEWCGGAAVDTESGGAVQVFVIGTSGPSKRLVPVLAKAEQHVIFKKSQGYFVVITVDDFERIWEPVELERPLDTLVDN